MFFLSIFLIKKKTIREKDASRDLLLAYGGKNEKRKKKRPNDTTVTRSSPILLINVRKMIIVATLDRGSIRGSDSQSRMTVLGRRAGALCLYE